MFLQKALLPLSGEKSNHETADTQLWWKRGQDSAQGCLSHQLMEESLFRSRHGSRRLLNSSDGVAQSKSMSTKLPKPSQPWLIRCGPRIARVRHIFCALLICRAPQECLQKNGKDDVVSGYGQAWPGSEGRRGIHDLGRLQHPCAFPSPESKPGHQHTGKTLMLPMFVCVCVEGSLKSRILSICFCCFLEARSLV